jgi:ribose 5-phosphate isomerase B
MKRFDIITEIDARALAHGESVMLAKGGHITPLAQDTLKERRVTLVHEGHASADAASLVPRADIRTVAIASDHTGIRLRQALTAFLRARGLAVLDLGADGPDPVDYPDVAASVADAVGRREADGGIVIDGAGIGSAMAANKVPGVRAANAHDVSMARNAREHNYANVLTLGARMIGEGLAIEVVDTFLATPWGAERHGKRVAKISAIEDRYSRDAQR